MGPFFTRRGVFSSASRPAGNFFITPRKASKAYALGGTCARAFVHAALLLHASSSTSANGSRGGRVRHGGVRGFGCAHSHPLPRLGTSRLIDNLSTKVAKH